MPFINGVVRGTLIICILPLPSELAIYYFAFILVKHSFKKKKCWLLFLFEKEIKPNVQEAMAIPPPRAPCQAAPAEP